MTQLLMSLSLTNSSAIINVVYTVIRIIDGFTGIIDAFVRIMDLLLENKKME